MSFSNMALTLLHVEDDPSVAGLVQAAFKRFGFRGRIITAGRVSEALDLLDRSPRDTGDINLILVDMQLPDGTGLDVIRRVKSDPAWQMTPVIALSGETATDMIDGAYALGANCYLPKLPTSKSSFDLLRSLYECWLKDAFLPRAPLRDRLQSALFTSVRLRARHADFYTRLAGVFDDEPEEMAFWLDRALSAGNLSNLLAFFQGRVSEKDLPGETIERFVAMQARVTKALATAEGRLRSRPAPTPAEVYRWVLDFTDARDEELVAEVLAHLFPKGPAATTALKARAACQLTDFGNYILERTEDAELRQKAQALLDWAERFAVKNEETGEVRQ